MSFKVNDFAIYSVWISSPLCLFFVSLPPLVAEFSEATGVFAAAGTAEAVEELDALEFEAALAAACSSALEIKEALAAECLSALEFETAFAAKCFFAFAVNFCFRAFCCSRLSCFFLLLFDLRCDFARVDDLFRADDFLLSVEIK
jgi:hypothetical protein